MLYSECQISGQFGIIDANQFWKSIENTHVHVQ